MHPRFWRLLSAPAVLVACLGVAAGQLLVFPIETATVSLQAITEICLFLVVVVGLYVVTSSRELADLEAEAAEGVYLPLVVGLGLFAVRAITDVLDEFLAHPEISLSIFEDISMILGIVSLLVGLSRWSTQRRRQEELLRAQRDRLSVQNDRLEEFASIVSHDLRNPLNVAQGNVELALETRDLGYLDATTRALDRIEAIITDVLELARAGQQALDATAFSIREVAAAAWSTVETGEAELSLEFGSDHTVRGDPKRVQQLLENLFRNSVEHGSASSRTRLDDPVEHGIQPVSGRSASGDGRNLVVRVGPLSDGFYVEDSGRGIPAEDRDAVVEPGYTTDPDGVGLGLSIVREIVRVHEWSVSIADGPEGGARFEFRTASPAERAR